MTSELVQLVAFLHDDKASVREIALNHLVPYSVAGADSQEKIFKHDNCRAVKDLKILARDRKPATVQDSETILSNLCDDEELRELITDDDRFIKLVVEQLVDFTNINADLASILLSNMAKSDNILRVFDVTIDEKKQSKDQKGTFKSSKAVDYLVDLFVKGDDHKLNRYANFDYLSYFIADISRFEKGRKYLISEQSYDGKIPLTKLLEFASKSDSKVRREGIASAIKNCLFETDRQIDLMEDRRINLLPYLLGPLRLSGNKGLSEEEVMKLPEELQKEDKGTESVKGIQMVYLECILLLCVTRKGRDYLRSRGVYPLIREFDKASKDDQVTDICYRIVDMLMRDEKHEYDAEKEQKEIAEFMRKEDEESEKSEDDDDDDDDDDDKIIEVA